mgnify:CR=1 FL=1
MFRTVLLIVLGVAVGIAGLRISSYYGEAARQVETPAEAPEPVPPEEPAGSDQRPRTILRNVSPEGVFTGPVMRSRPLPRADTASPGNPDRPPEPAKAKTERFFRVQVLDAGTLRSGERRIGLAGIDAPAADATCKEEGGGQWPCGRAAKAALTLFLRGRSIDCDKVEGGATSIVTTCRSGGDDLAAWLVGQGWAGADRGGGYTALADEARREKRGLYQTEWRAGGEQGNSTAPLPEGIIRD